MVVVVVAAVVVVVVVSFPLTGLPAFISAYLDSKVPHIMSLRSLILGSKPSFWSIYFGGHKVVGILCRTGS